PAHRRVVDRGERDPRPRGNAEMTRLLGGNPPRQFRRGAVNGLRQVLRRLRTADREQAAEDEAGYTLDAGFLGPIGFGLDAHDVLIAGESLAHIVRVQAAIGSRADQDLAVGQVAAFAEIEFHQPLFHASGVRSSPQDQAVTVERVRLAFDLVAGVGQAGIGGGIDHALTIAVVALDRTELGGWIVLAAP